MTDKATFAAGCFWGVEAEFRKIEGVVATTVGYTGGTVADPSYELVCSGTTNHAEAVLVEYDPDQVPYERLLDLFWANHDPTQLNRQGPDVGTQYRTAVYFHTPEQEIAAARSKAEAQARYPRPIATEIAPAVEFYPAEDYHQRYLEKRGMASCSVTVANGAGARPIA